MHTCQHSFALSVIRVFVQEFEDLYGPKELVYNIHNLLHLADDVKHLGMLDNFSAFPFESYLGQLRKDVSGPCNPAAQVANRLEERFIAGSSIDWGAFLTDDRLASRVTPTDGFRLGNAFHSSTEPNNIVLVNNRPATIVAYHAQRHTVEIRRFTGLNNFFDQPCESKHLGIFKVHSLERGCMETKINNINCKCILLPLENEYLVIPLLHSVTK